MSLSDSCLDPIPNEEIIRLIKEGKNDLVLRHNIKLIYKVASKYYCESPGFGIEDLVQVGALGLLKAVEAYDSEVGATFCTYASWWIRCYVSKEVERNRLIRTSARTISRLREIEKYATKVNREPNLKEIMEMFECPKSCAELLIFERNKKISDDAPLKVLRSNPAAEDFSEEAALAFPVLTSRELHIITKRFGLDGEDAQTLDVVSRGLNLSKERVRQVQKDALKKMRRSLVKQGVER